MCSNKSKKYCLMKAIRPLHALCVFVGLSPYCYNKEGKLRTSKIATIRNFLALLSQILMAFIIHKHLKSSPKVTENILKMIIDVEMFIWKTLPCLIVILEFLFRHCTIKIIQNLQNCDDLIQEKLGIKYKITIDYQSANRLILRLFPVILVFNFTNLYFDWYNQNNFELYTFLFNFGAYFTFGLTVPTFLLKYMVLNHLIVQRLQVVNEVLEKCRPLREKVSIGKI